MKCPKCKTEIETHEEMMTRYAQEMSKLSIEYAKKTGLLFLPLPLGILGDSLPFPFPLKWFPEIEKILKSKEGINEYDS